MPPPFATQKERRRAVGESLARSTIARSDSLFSELSRVTRNSFPIVIRLHCATSSVAHLLAAILIQQQ